MSAESAANRNRDAPTLQIVPGTATIDVVAAEAAVADLLVALGTTRPRPISLLRQEGGGIVRGVAHRATVRPDDVPQRRRLRRADLGPRHLLPFAVRASVAPTPRSWSSLRS